MSRHAAYAIALILGAAGGAVFYWAHMPLPWLLGSMVATTVAAFCSVPVRAPHAIRRPMSAV
ncbi:MAG: hypothetical protein JNL61_17705, partial [Rhizobiaceae bacterium]|nr:hypothetical protein [Rhizobiaceae bacterium]